MGTITSSFEVEKDKYISGIVFSSNGIEGYYTSPLGNVSQYNFSPVTIKNLGGEQKGVFAENPESIKFPNGYFLQQIYKTITKINKDQMLVTNEFVTANIQNDKKSFISKKEMPTNSPPHLPFVPFNYESKCSSYITGISSESTFADMSKEKFVVICPPAPAPAPAPPPILLPAPPPILLPAPPIILPAPPIILPAPPPILLPAPPKTTTTSITTTSPDMSTNTKLFILMCIIICIYLYTRNKPESNVNQRETNSSNNIQIPAY